MNWAWVLLATSDLEFFHAEQANSMWEWQESIYHTHNESKLAYINTMFFFNSEVAKASGVKQVTCVFNSGVESQELLLGEALTII